MRRVIAAVVVVPALLGLGAFALARGNGASSPARPGGAAPARKEPPGWLVDEAAARGVEFRLGHGGRSPLTILETMGTGCAVLDFDADGHADLFLVGQTGAGDGRCGLFRNDGTGRFENVTAGSGLEAPGMYLGVASGDFDNDGLPDLLLTGYGESRLYRNLGKGRFADRTAGSGLTSPSPTSWQTSVAVADVNGDGLLDLYVGRYVVFNEETIRLCDYGEYQSSCGPMFYDPQFGSLYLNRGNFRFQDVTREYGLDKQHGKCLGAAFADVNDDGWPDLYLGNDEMPGDLFLNQGGKRFVNKAFAAGVATSADGKMQGAMGVEFGDLDRDQRLDLVVSTYEFEPTSVYLNRGGEMFENRSLALGVDQLTRPYVGFGTKFLDADNDGWLDLLVGNGHIHDNQPLIDKLGQYAQPMQLFRSREGGGFSDASAEAGSSLTTPGVIRGIATGDLNDDGLLDAVATDLEGTARVLINRHPQPGNWLRVKLRGTRSNRDGIGARIQVIAGEQRWTAQAATCGSYLSASDPRVHVGLGATRQVDRVEVRWPSGRRTVVESPQVPGDLLVVESK
ncbi:MAG: CRTAC1 family protein [Armatimonadota bacterium]